MKNLKEMKSIPIEDAAKIIGKSPQYIRLGLQQKRIPIGSAVKMSNAWSYHISYELLKNYVGIANITEYERS